jgi:hypothetical protein
VLLVRRCASRQVCLAAGKQSALRTGAPGRERILARVQVGLVFRSQLRGVAHDPEVERSLTGQPQALGFREYVDAGPCDWLVSLGRGHCGPTRYARAEHRVGRRDFGRRPSGVICWHPHARVLSDFPAELRRELAGPAPKGRQAAARHPRLSRTRLGFRG